MSALPRQPASGGRDALTMDELLDRAARVRMVIFDVDGVLTDGSLYLSDDGQEYKAFHSRDGHGMKMLLESGVQIAVITGRSSQVVAKRMESLGIQFVYQGQRDKLPAFEALLQRVHLEPRADRLRRRRCGRPAGDAPRGAGDRGAGRAPTGQETLALADAVPRRSRRGARRL